MGKNFPNLDYIGIRYPEYFKTEWWTSLKEKLIYTNPNVKCWICSKKDTLLIHHEKYDNLFHERLGRDIFILCYECHSQLHFSLFLGIYKRKTPLKTWNLKRRRLFLKLQNCIQIPNIGLSVWYLFRYLFVV